MTKIVHKTLPGDGRGKGVWDWWVGIEGDESQGDSGCLGVVRAWGG